MTRPHEWNPPKPVVFAGVLCLMMLGGEIAAGGPSNPLALPFYCFLPAALWMIANDAKRDARAIAALEARIDRLEASRHDMSIAKAG